jgi:hypothetical protein
MQTITKVFSSKKGEPGSASLALRSRQNVPCSEFALGTSDFDAQMCGIKFWKGDENLRLVSKKTVSTEF